MPHIHRSSVLICLGLGLALSECRSTFGASTHFPPLFIAIDEVQDRDHRAPKPCQDMPTAQSIDLHTPLLSQRAADIEAPETKLCWASALAMIARSLGHEAETCDVATLFTEDGANCCTESGRLKTESSTCDHGEHRSTLSARLHRLGLYHDFVLGALREDVLRHELSNGRPVLVGLDYYTVSETGERERTNGHTVVITGFDQDGYLVNDPDSFPAYRLSYEQLLHGRSWEPWEWISSWYLLSFQADGCVPSFNPRCACTE